MMGRWMRGALALLVVLCAASPAGAKSIPNNRSLQTDTPMEPGAIGVWNGSRWVSATGDGDGNIYVRDADPDYSRNRLFRDVIRRDNLGVAVADSNAIPIDVSPYRYLKLLIKATPRGGANTTVRLGIQLREHADANLDTNSVFVEYPYGKIDNSTMTASVLDTTLVGHIVTGSATTPWSGEFSVLVNGNRSAPGSGASAIVYAYPNGLAIPLDSILGRPARFNQLSIRVRNLNAGSPSVDVTVHVLGFAQ